MLAAAWAWIARAEPSIADVVAELRTLERSPSDALMVVVAPEVGLRLRAELAREPWLEIRTGWDPVAGATRRIARGWTCAAALSPELVVTAVGGCSPEGTGWDAEIVRTLPRFEPLHGAALATGAVGGTTFLLGYAIAVGHPTADAPTDRSGALAAVYGGGALLLATPPLALAGSLVQRHRYRRAGVRVSDAPLVIGAVASLGFDLLAVATAAHLAEDTGDAVVMLGGAAVAGFGWHAVALHQARDRITGE